MTYKANIRPDPQREPTVAFVGLGAMGGPMAARVGLVAENRFAIFDSSPEALRRNAAAGRVATSLEDAVAGADILMTMLPADRHVASVAADLVRLGWSGLLLDLSTIHPGTIRQVASDAGPDVRVVSASCMKSVAAAVDGSLTIYVDGDREDLALVRPLLDSMASEVLEFDGPGDAKTLKIINNMMVAGINLVIAEAVTLGHRYGLSTDEIVRSAVAARLGGWAIENQVVKHVLSDDLGPGRFSTRYMAKDLALAGRLADSLGRDRFLCGPILSALRGAAALGHGDDYHPVITRWIDHAASVATQAPTTPAVDVLPLLLDWIRVAEELIARHGVELAEAAGMARLLAAKSLAISSAASAAVARISQDPRDPSRADLEVMHERVENALRLAADCETPALSMEAVHDHLARRILP